MAAKTKSKTKEKKSPKKAAEVIDVIGLSMKGHAKPDAQITMVPYSKVHVLPGFNPRTKLGDVEGLTVLIKAQGLISPPTVRPDADKEGHYLIVAGERRYRALGKLEYSSIPVIIRPDLKDDDQKALALAIAENSENGRINLDPRDRGNAYKQLADKGWPVTKIASHCSAHSRDVRRCMELVSAPEDVQLKVAAGALPFVVALEMAKYDDDATRARIFDYFEQNGDEKITLKQVKKLAKQASAGSDDEPAKASNKKKGKKRAAALIVRRSAKEETAQLEALCFSLLNATEEEKSLQNWFEMRGAIGALLWSRGDTEWPVLPPIDPSHLPNAKAAAKELKRIGGLIEAHAGKYEAPETAAVSEDADAELVGA